MNRKNIDVDTVTMDLFSDSASSDRWLLPLTGKSTLELLRRWSDAGLLRRLDVALAAFVQEQDPLAAPCVLVATALLPHLWRCWVGPNLRARLWSPCGRCCHQT